MAILVPRPHPAFCHMQLIFVRVCREPVNTANSHTLPFTPTCISGHYIRPITYDIMPCTLQNELREEMRIYREHLAEQAREEERREREVDALVNSEVEKQWGKRLEQWRKEREARKKLMQDVLNERKKQIEEKCEFNSLVPGHSQILSHSRGEKLGCEIKSGSGLGMRL